MPRDHGGRGRVLIVEDEALIALETSTHLLEWGYDVCGIAATMRDALRQAEAAQPVLALVDVNLKDGDDGVALASLLRERYGARIVFLTGFNDEASRRRMMAARPAGAVFKPYDPVELNQVLGSALA